MLLLLLLRRLAERKIFKRQSSHPFDFGINCTTGTLHANTGSEGHVGATGYVNNALGKDPGKGKEKGKGAHATCPSLAAFECLFGRVFSAA